MACRVWLADPAEFEAQPAGFGKRRALGGWRRACSARTASCASTAPRAAPRSARTRARASSAGATARPPRPPRPPRNRSATRRLVDDGLVGSLVRVLTECEVPPEPYGGGHLLRIFACEALARVVAKSDAFSGDAAVISERQLDAVLALFENLHCVDGGDQSTAACRAFARAAFPELDAPVTSVVCRCVEIDRWFGWS
ncbi:hypothetical protein JL721_5166 [Aureococcus anophagefferens]|nr:hypothetical protein JL721_5166 [Aureococcus anophagefferens]